MQSNAEKVEDYINALPEDRKNDLTNLRNLILELAPDAIEYMNYGMPYYELNGHLCAFASQKNYISLYLMNTPVLQRNLELFGKLKIGKGCVRFKKLEDLPIDAVVKVIRESIDDNAEHYNDHC